MDNAIGNSIFNSLVKQNVKEGVLSGSTRKYLIWGGSDDKEDVRDNLNTSTAGICWHFLQAALQLIAFDNLEWFT